MGLMNLCKTYKNITTTSQSTWPSYVYLASQNLEQEKKKKKVSKQTIPHIQTLIPKTHPNLKLSPYI